MLCKGLLLGAKGLLLLRDVHLLAELSLAERTERTCTLQRRLQPLEAKPRTVLARLLSKLLLRVELLLGSGVRILEPTGLDIAHLGAQIASGFRLDHSLPAAAKRPSLDCFPCTLGTSNIRLALRLTLLDVHHILHVGVHVAGSYSAELPGLVWGKPCTSAKSTLRGCAGEPRGLADLPSDSLLTGGLERLLLQRVEPGNALARVGLVRRLGQRRCFGQRLLRVGFRPTRQINNRSLRAATATTRVKCAAHAAEVARMLGLDDHFDPSKNFWYITLWTA